MNEAEENTSKLGRRIIKKYILHQKVNPKLLGVELLNKHLDTPNEAYLSCKLIFKKDIRSLTELEQITKKIYETWTKKNNQLLIKKINVYTSTAYIVLTFTIGFYEEAHVKQLRDLKECAKELIETYDNLVKQEKEAEYNKKETELYSALEKFGQLTKKMEALEDKLIKNESIVMDSGELLKMELTKVSQTIKEQLHQADSSTESDPNNAKKNKRVKEITPKVVGAPFKKKAVKKENTQVRKYMLNRSKQSSEALEIQRWISTKQLEKSTKREKATKKEGLKKAVTKLEMDVLKCFTEGEEGSKKHMVPKKKFLTLKAKIEFIDYLWMLLELEGKEEIIIADKLSCRKLIEELGQFMENVEKVATGPTIFNYWVYCSQEMLVKLEGYAVLKDFLSNALKFNTNTMLNE